MKNLKKLSVLSLIAALLLSGCGRIGKDIIIDTPPTSDRVEIKTEGETSENVGSAADRFNNAGSESIGTEENVIDAKKLIADELIDLTTQPNLDVINANWEEDDRFKVLDPADLDMLILNRKITLTGTKIGDFLETFRGTQDIIDIEQLEFNKEIHPYQGVHYRFVLQQYPSKELEFTAYNLTSTVAKMSDCIIYSMSWQCDDGVENYKVQHSLFDENGNFDTEYKSGTSADFNYTVGVYDSTDTKVFVEVSPLVNDTAKDYIKSLSNSENCNINVMAQSVGDGLITILDKTIDIKKNTIADIFNMYETEDTLVLPKYSVPVFIHYESDGLEVNYKLSGYAGFMYTFDGHCMYADTSNIYDGNLYLAPLNSVALDINFLTNENEIIKLAGITNLDKQDAVVKWYNDSVKSTVNFEMEDGSEDELAFSVAVDDKDFLNMYNNKEIPSGINYELNTTTYNYTFEFDDNKDIERIWFYRDCE